MTNILLILLSLTFTGTVKSGGYSWNAKNSSEIMKIGWNELVYVVEDGTCEITGSRVR